jgi:hypothetical protein
MESLVDADITGRWVKKPHYANGVPANVGRDLHRSLNDVAANYSRVVDRVVGLGSVGGCGKEQ